MIALLGRTRSLWRQQSAASLLLALAKVYAHVGHDHLSEDCHKTSFPRRLLASRCASYGGWRFLEGDKCATFLSGPSGLFFQVAVAPPQPPKLMLAMATLLETVTSGLPNMQALAMQSTTFQDTLLGPPGWSRFSPPKQPTSWWRASRRGTYRPPRANPRSSSTARKSSRREFFATVGGAGNRRVRLGAQRWSRFAAGQATTRPRCQRGDWGGQQGARSAPRQLRKAGAHTRNLTLTGSNDGVLWGSEVLGFTPAQLKATRADAAKATYRLSRGQCGHNHDGLRPGCWGEEHRPRLFDITDKGCAGLCDWSLGGALQTSTQCRPRCAAPWPGSAISRDPGAAPWMRLPLSCSRCCGWAGGRSLRGTSPPTMARRSTSWQWRQRRFVSGSIRLLWCGPTDLHTGTIPKGRFSEEPSGRSWFLASWRSGHCGIATCWSGWFTWDLDTGWAIAASEIGRRPMPALPRRPRHYHRYYECPALQTERDMEVRQAARSLEPQYREQFAHGIFPIPSTILPTASFQQSCPVLWHNRLRRHPGGAHFHGRLLFGQWRFATSRLGGGGSRRRGGPQVSGLWGSAVGRAAWAIITRRRGLRRCHGRTHHLGSAHAAHRLRRYRRDGQRAKVQSFGCRGPPSTRLEQASGFPR